MPPTAAPTTPRPRDTRPIVRMARRRSVRSRFTAGRAGGTSTIGAGGGGIGAGGSTIGAGDGGFTIAGTIAGGLAGPVQPQSRVAEEFNTTSRVALLMG